MLSYPFVFGGPLIFVVIVIWSETEQLRFRGNFSEVAASVPEWSFRIIYNTRKDHFRTEAFIFCQPSITFSQKILRANSAALARRFDDDLQKHRKCEYRLDERPGSEEHNPPCGLRARAFSRSRPDEMQNFDFLININMLLIKLLF